VVSLKIFGVVSGIPREDVRRQRAVFREKNLFFALGILIYFLFLSLVLGMAGLAWGQIFQMPAVVMLVAAVVFGLGLSLMGVFDLPVIDLKSPRTTQSNPRLQALFTGILATLLATPCSGPFLGGVLAWTLLQPPLVISAVFLAIGLGMASPYLLFSLRPEAGRFFPRPGAWIVRLEQLMSFFLFGTCVYLFSILPEPYHVPALVLFLASGLAAWLWGKCTSLSDEPVRRLSVRGAAVVVFALACLWATRPPVQAVHWQPFVPDSFRAGLGSAPMLVDFTAEWCPNCKLLERTVLTAKTLAEISSRYGLTPVQVDLTGDNPEGLALLRALGSQSIPVVAIFPAGEGSRAPVVLRDLFTAGQLDEALRQALPGDGGSAARTPIPPPGPSRQVPSPGTSQKK
jgi:thiol:disulfide interchange protein DsbD